VIARYATPVLCALALFQAGVYLWLAGKGHDAQHLAYMNLALVLWWAGEAIHMETPHD